MASGEEEEKKRSDAWRDAMPLARRAAVMMALRGDVVIMQRGARVDPSAEIRGPIRIARAASSSSSSSSDTTRRTTRSMTRTMSH